MKNQSIFNFCNFYIILWLVYNLQAILLGEKGGTVSLLMVASLLSISIYHLLYAFSHYKIPVYLKGLTMIIIMFTIYGVFLIISGKTIMFSRTYTVVKNYTYIKSIYTSLLPIFSFYVFTRKKLLTMNTIKTWTIVFLFVAMVQFLQAQQTASMLQMDNEVEEITNNYSYSFLAIIPLLSFWREKRAIQYLGLAISMVFIILGMKRGAILIGAICIFLFMCYSLKTATRKQRTWTVLLSVVIIIVGIYVISYLLQNSIYFNIRLENTIEGDSSGRDRLYGTFLRHFLREKNIFQLLFGNGANATLTISSNYAHNDWLEIVINQGLMGICVYIAYWIMFVKTWKKSKFNQNIFFALGLTLLICFMKTLFSMSYNAMTIYDAVCIGYSMGIISDYERFTA